MSDLDFYREEYDKVMIQCQLPVLLVGTRENCAPGPTSITLLDQVTEITTYEHEPHITELTSLDGFVWVVVPAKGWRRSYATENQTKRSWGGRKTSRHYMSSQYRLELQDYFVTSDDEGAISEQYWYDRQAEKVRAVFSRQFVFATGLKQFDGYPYQNYLHDRDCLFAVVPSGAGFEVKGENTDNGTKQCSISIEAAFPDFVFGA